MAIDVGGTAIKYTILDETAEILKIYEIKSPKHEEEFYNSLNDIILPNLNLIEGIALSFPGLINVREGIVHTCGSFRWMHDLPLKSILEKRYSKRVWIENDGKCCALAELWKGNLSNILSSAIINIQSILDVEKFCIGGGISSQDVLINEIKEIIHDFFINKASKAIKEPKIEKCFFENSAGCVGALYHFLVMENK